MILNVRNKSTEAVPVYQEIVTSFCFHCWGRLPSYFPPLLLHSLQKSSYGGKQIIIKHHSINNLVIYGSIVFCDNIWFIRMTGKHVAQINAILKNTYTCFPWIPKLPFRLWIAGLSLRQQMDDPSKPTQCFHVPLTSLKMKPLKSFVRELEMIISAQMTSSGFWLYPPYGLRKQSNLWGRRPMR